MPMWLRVLGWSAIVVFGAPVSERNFDWLQQAWFVLALVFVVIEYMNFIRHTRKMQNEVGLAGGRHADETARRNKELAEKKAAQARAEEQARREALADAITKLSGLVTHHEDELDSKRDELITYGPYQIPDRTKWVAEQEFFIDNVLDVQAPEISSSLTRDQTLHAIDELLDGKQVTVDDLHEVDPSPSAAGPPPAPRADPPTRSPEPDPAPEMRSDSGEEMHRRTDADQYDRVSKQLNLIAFILGLVGTVLYLSAYVALIVGVVALRRDKPAEGGSRRWQAWTGTILGGLFVLVSVTNALA